MSLISVIVPCYNQAQYLDECLQSVVDQTYQHWECIIVNDGSPDNTEDIAASWLKKDQRFKYIYQDNKGVSAARNFGIENAKGEWILPLDADDLISDDYLELASDNFSTNCKLIYCNASKFGIKNEKWNLKEFSLGNLALQNLIFISAFFKKCDFNENCRFDENLCKGLEDWDFWISLLKDGGAVIKLRQICFYYRIKKISRNENLLMDSESSFKYIERKHIDFFQDHLPSLHSQFYRCNSYDEMNKRFLNKLANMMYEIRKKL